MGFVYNPALILLPVAEGTMKVNHSGTVKYKFLHTLIIDNICNDISI